MASTRELWGKHFSEDRIPGFPCPACDRGTLVPVPKSLRHLCSESSQQAEQEGFVSPPDIVAHFNLFLKCSIGTCGEIVSVQGESQLTERGRDEYHRDEDRFYYLLTPRSMFPAPPLSTVPPTTPVELEKEFRVAFSLFWVDLGSCANRLRIIVEKLLDHLGVARVGPKGKKQKVGSLDLFDRIDIYRAAEPEHGATFDALRVVGNLGSHEGDVSRRAVLDSFELMQEALAELFGQRKARLAAIRSELIAKKGKV